MWVLSGSLSCSPTSTNQIDATNFVLYQQIYDKASNKNWTSLDLEYDQSICVLILKTNTEYALASPPL